MRLKKSLKAKIVSKRAHVGVLGLGYVGLPLALALAESRFRTTGFDISKERVNKVNHGESYIDDVASDRLSALTQSGRFKATTSFQQLAKMDCVVICVPTPLGKTRQPDLTFVLDAMRSVARYLHRGQLIILESTTYPGTTEENILPMLEKTSGLKVEQDFFLGFSPERVDPGNHHFKLVEIPKIIGGVGKHSSELLKSFYQSVFQKVVPVSCARAAEMVKLLENTFRSVNIGLINEMAKVCHALGIDIWEVIRAASSKPFGFMPFYPGPGIGGHCINVDSMYLAWKARLHGSEPRLIELAQQINDEMPMNIIERVMMLLNDDFRAIRESRILILGVAYKKNVSDVRESPSFAIMERLIELGAKVSYHDPCVPDIKLDSRSFMSQKLTQHLIKAQDLILILTDHTQVNYDLVVKHSKRILDTRNVLESVPLTGKRKKGSIVKL